MRDAPPDLVLSGVNQGANIGDDMTYSGTVAAAMEATILDIPAIALSQQTNDAKQAQWPTAAHHAPDIIRRLMAEGWPAGILMNVNFPDRPPMTSPASPSPSSPRGGARRAIKFTN